MGRQWGKDRGIAGLGNDRRNICEEITAEKKVGENHGKVGGEDRGKVCREKIEEDMWGKDGGKVGEKRSREGRWENDRGKVGGK